MQRIFSKTKNSNYGINIAVFLLCLLGCGLYSMYLGKELCWDLANYHFYLPYAVLHHRDQIDYFPVSFIHQYLNPTLDFLSYFLIIFFSPLTTQFLLGVIHGFNIFILFLILQMFLQVKMSLSLLVLLFLGFYSPIFMPGIGSLANDNIISIFVLGYVFLQTKFLLKYSKDFVIPTGLIFLSGLILGLGIGLKLTAAIFAVGGFFATLFLPIKKTIRLKILLFWGLGVCIGICFAAGYWMLHLWREHGNPFFPFFNKIFQSPDFPLLNWRDLRFLPQSFMENLFFPFYFSWDGRTSEMHFRDFRFAVIYLLLVVFVLRWLHNRISIYMTKNADQQIRSAIQVKIHEQWFFLFFIFSYFVWQYYFSVARYLVSLEMLAPVIIYFLLTFLGKPNYFFVLLQTVVFSAIFFLEVPSPTFRTNWYKGTFFNIQLPKVVQNTPEALVLLAYPAYAMSADPRPQNYLIPFFPAHWHFIGIPFYHEKYLWDSMTHQKLSFYIQKESKTAESKLHLPKPIFLLAAEENMSELVKIAGAFGLKRAGVCENILSDREMVIHQNILLCPMISVGTFFGVSRNPNSKLMASPLAPASKYSAS